MVSFCLAWLSLDGLKNSVTAELHDASVHCAADGRRTNGRGKNSKHYIVSAPGVDKITRVLNRGFEL